MWYDCKDCVFASNSTAQAHKHGQDNPEHTVKSEED